MPEKKLSTKVAKVVGVAVIIVVPGSLIVIGTGAVVWGVYRLLANKNAKRPSTPHRHREARLGSKRKH